MTTIPEIGSEMSATKAKDVPTAMLWKDEICLPLKGQNLENKGLRYFALFGNPVGHSLSPLMHNATLKELDYPGRYLAFSVQDIGAAVQGIRGLNLQGVSVTLPFKTKVMAFLDEIDPCAAEIGAVNTIKNEAGYLKGFNTDWIGVVKSLGELMDIKGKSFIVLGSGGAARAAIYGLKREGGRPIVVSRNRDTGTVLAEEWGIACYGLEALPHLEAEVLINTTPVGMAPAENDTPLSEALVARFPYVMDMIYNPLETRLLRLAREAGRTPISGLGMFVHQGAAQFEIWTGITPPIDYMREKVRSALRRKAGEMDERD